jgi:hypothetical protein
MITTTVNNIQVTAFAEVCGTEFVADLPAGVTHVFYWYEAGCYEGDGWALAVRAGGPDEKGNVAYCWSLGHCSCYGPFDEPSWDGLRPQDVLMHTMGDGMFHAEFRRYALPLLGVSEAGSENGND